MKDGDMKTNSYESNVYNLSTADISLSSVKSIDDFLYYEQKSIVNYNLKKIVKTELIIAK